MTQELTGLEYLRANEIKGMKCEYSRPYVFLSYSHDEHDALIVMNVFKKLYEKGYNLWIDIANMPHDENSWKDAADQALVGANCVLAFYFRSESSMIKDTIAEELATINEINHIKRTITIDIWENSGMNAEKYRRELLNSGQYDDKVKNCRRICDIVKIDNKAIRLASDAGNDIERLIYEMEEVMKEDGLSGHKVSLSSKSVETVEHNAEQQRISLPDFLKNYNNSKFNKSTFSKLRLVGKDQYSNYNTDFYYSTYSLVWAFVKSILEQRGEEYIQLVNSRNEGIKNPPFITAEEHKVRESRGDSVKYRQLDVKGLEGYSMCRHYGQYDWIANVLRKRMQELGLPLDQFVFEYETDAAVNTRETQQNDRGPASNNNVSDSVGRKDAADNSGGITGPVSVKGGSTLSSVEKVDGKISLPEFIKTYDYKKFQADSCKSISLCGIGEYEKYSIGKFETARNLVFAFSMNRLDDMGIDYILLVNNANPGKNPIFITTEEHNERKARKENVSYKAVTSDKAKGYSMCTHYSEYHWIQNSLKKQLNALGWPLDSFYLEFDN